MLEKETMQAQEEKPTKIQSTDLEEAEMIESENFLRAKEARLRLDRALSLQEATTNELRKQGETIAHVKSTAIKVLENSKASCETQIRIKEESKLLPSFGSLVSKLKRWWKKNAKMEREIEEIKNRKEDLPAESEAVDCSPGLTADLTSTEFVPGENATNNELAMILSSLKRVNAGAKNQAEIVKGQKSNLQDISKLEGFSSAIVSETEKQMHKK